jgi:hypothetical protein
MEVRIQTLQDFEFTDEGARPLSREVLAAVLRKHAFGVDEAADELEPATAPDPCPTSIAGQWQIGSRIAGWDLPQDHDPPEMTEYVTGLRELPLTDKRDRPFCDEVIVTALRCAFYDPLEAADWLIIEADRIHRRKRNDNLEAKRAAYGELARRFTLVYNSTIGREPKPWHAAWREPTPVASQYGHK